MVKKIKGQTFKDKDIYSRSQKEKKMSAIFCVLSDVNKVYSHKHG